MEYGGLNRNFLIGSLSPGEVGEKLYVDAATAADPEGVRIRSAIKTPQGQDAKPDNDVRVSRITSCPPADSVLKEEPARSPFLRKTRALARPLGSQEQVDGALADEACTRNSLFWDSLHFYLFQ